MSEDLTPSELVTLTGQKKPERQAAALVTLGIPFRCAGRMLYVPRAVAEHWPQWQATHADAVPQMHLVR